MKSVEQVVQQSGFGVVGPVVVAVVGPVVVAVVVPVVTPEPKLWLIIQPSPPLQGRPHMKSSEGPGPSLEVFSQQVLEETMRVQATQDGVELHLAEQSDGPEEEKLLAALLPAGRYSPKVGEGQPGKQLYVLNAGENT